MGKLLPCPFCGIPALCAIHESTGYFVLCENVQCLSAGPYRDSADDAKKAWNTRKEERNEEDRQCEGGDYRYK